MSKKKALLIDDSKSARFFLRNMLKKNDVIVEMVESGEAALDFLKENRPDVIFMDHLMPGIDGFQATQAIKSDPGTSDIPVVMCTSNEGAEYVAQAKAIGAFDILNKPPTEDRLRAILGQLESLEMAAPAAPMAAQAPAPAMSREDIEAVAAAHAESIVQNRVQTMLDEALERAQAMIEEASERLRGEIREEIRVQGGEAARVLLEERLGPLRDEILFAAKQQSQTLSQDSAAELLDARMDDILARAAEPVSDSLQALRSEWAGERQSLVREATSAATKAAESAVLSAQKSISDSASLFAQETAKRAAEQVAREAVTEAGKGLGGAAIKAEAQAKMYAMVAGGVGVLAALLVYFLG